MFDEKKQETSRETVPLMASDVQVVLEQNQRCVATVGPGDGQHSARGAQLLPLQVHILQHLKLNCIKMKCCGSQEWVT